MAEYDEFMTDDYIFGTDVLGDGFDFSSFSPWLKMFTGSAGGGGADAAAKAKEEERRKEEEKRRQEAEARQRNILLAIGGVLLAGVAGTGIYLVARRK